MNTIPMDSRTEAIQDTLIAISVVSRQLAGKIEALKRKGGLSPTSDRDCLQSRSVASTQPCAEGWPISKGGRKS